MGCSRLSAFDWDHLLQRIREGHQGRLWGRPWKGVVHGVLLMRGKQNCLPVCIAILNIFPALGGDREVLVNLRWLYLVLTKSVVGIWIGSCSSSAEGPSTITRLGGLMPLLRLFFLSFFLFLWTIHSETSFAVRFDGRLGFVCRVVHELLSRASC